MLFFPDFILPLSGNNNYKYTKRSGKKQEFIKIVLSIELRKRKKR